MWGQLFTFLFFISPILSCSLSDLHGIPDYGSPGTVYIPIGEPFFVRCPSVVQQSENSYNITWFKNASHAEISSDIQARIHQGGNFLIFFPSRLEDSGFYLCVYRDAKECWKEVVKVDVFQNDNDLCYKEDALYNYIPYQSGALTLECPFVADLVNIETTQFLWFKDCKLLDLRTDTSKYYISQNFLNINDVTSEDNGYYKCVTSLLHNGTTYNISRSIKYNIRALPLAREPVVLYPTGNFIEAELGSPVTVTCEAQYSRSSRLIWLVNDTLINDYFDEKRVKMGEEYNAINKHGENVTCLNLTFISVEKEDYDVSIFCLFMSYQQYEAFFKLKRPGPNHQGVLIAVFVTAAFFVAFTVIIIKVFKVDLVLWYRSSCFFHPHQNDGKIFDAYIMYPRNATGNSVYDMDLFVLKMLPEVLEKQCAYRLFIIGRDDLPGQAMADLVDEAISQSRRLIIILGQVSKQSNLGEDFEQRIAMYDALIRNQIKVILIEIEKITDYMFMPESIKYLKQKQGVIRWKDTFSDASLSRNTRFWKNIRYQMPPVPCQSVENPTEDL